MRGPCRQPNEMIETCYMCEGAATTREHAPAKVFFPEPKDLDGIDLRRNLITVPSCAAHNIATSKDDEYVVALVAAYIGNTKLAADHFTTKVLRALQRSPGYAATVVRNAARVPTNGLGTVALRVDDDRFERVMEKTARAVVFHHTGRKWNGALCILSPSLVQAQPGTGPLAPHPQFGGLGGKDRCGARTGEVARRQSRCVLLSVCRVR